MALDRRAQAFGPLHNLGRRLRSILLDEASGEDGHDAGLGGELGESSGPLDRSLRCPLERLHDGVEGFVQAVPVNGARGPALLERAGRFADEQHRVLDPVERRPREGRVIDHFQAGVLEGDQMAGKIAAVDR